jgi:hypothetical protein
MATTEGVPTMHPTYPTLSSVIANATAPPWRRVPRLITPAELERDLGLVLADLRRDQPRIVDFLPELAMNLVLGRLARSGRLRPIDAVSGIRRPARP